jgi:hypothetical protein
MPDDPDYILDIRGLSDSAETEPSQHPDEVGGRKWIGVNFECCGVYTRIYKNREGTAYEGCCPKCARPVRVRVGQGGTDHRMFRAT